MISYLLKFTAIIIIMLPFYLLIRRPWRREAERETALGAFVLFMLGLLTLALQGNYQSPLRMLQSARQRLADGSRINLIPFRSIRQFFVRFRLNAFLINIVGNIVMFLPWGFGLPLLWKKRQSAFSAAFFSALLPIFIETIQLFIERSVDIDDLILNFTGGILGALCYALVRRRKPGIAKLSR